MSLSPEQLALRRSGITGTDLPAILGLSPWRTAFDVWLDKAGKAPSVEVNEDMERGTFLEDGAIRWYAHRTGARVEQPGTVVSRRNPLVIATPDGIVYLAREEPECGLEVKMPSSPRGWGEPGTDAVPDYYLPQVAWNMAATGLQKWDVFAVLGGKPCLYHVARDTELEGLLVEEASRFWRDHVVTGKPPEVTARDGAGVSALYPRHETSRLLTFATLAPEAQVTLEEYLRAYEEESAAADRLALWEARAKLVIGSAPGVDGLPPGLGFSRVDWKQNKGRKVTDWQKVAAAMRDGIPYAVAVETYTKAVDGARPFTPRPLAKWKQDKLQADTEALETTR